MATSNLNLKLNERVCIDENNGENIRDFFNRRKEKEAALGLLKSSDGNGSVWIIGERRAGKSSLLCTLINKCQHDVISFEISWSTINSPEIFYRNYLSELDKVIDIKGKNKRGLGLAPRDSIEFFEALNNRRNKIGNKTLIVGIDELDSVLHQLREERYQSELLGTLYELVNEGQKLIITTAHDPEEIVATPASPLIAKALPIRLTPFSDKDMDELIKTYINNSSEEILKKIRKWSGNWPYYAKVIIYHFLKLNSNEKNRFELALSESVETIDPICKHLYKHHWNDDELRALLLLSRKKEGISTKDLTMLGAEAVTAFKRMEKRGYLLFDKDRGLYKFRVLLIKKWIEYWTDRELIEKKLGLDRWYTGLDLKDV